MPIQGTSIYVDSIRGFEPQVKAFSPKKARLWEHHNALKEPVLLPIIASDPVAYLEDCKLNSIDKSVFLHLIGMRNACMILRPSQEYIAKKTGYVRETINRSLRRLRELGLVSSVYRHMRPCIYKVAQPYLDPEIRKELRYVGKAFLFLSMLMVGDAPVGNIYQYGTKQHVNPLIEPRSHEKLIRNNLLYITPYVSPLENSSSPGKQACGQLLCQRMVKEVVATDWEDVNNLSGKYTPPRDNFDGWDPEQEAASRQAGKQALQPIIISSRKEKPMESGRKQSCDYTNVKGLKLTKAGEINLSPFPVEALAFALQQIRLTKKKIDDPFRYYLYFCKKYCSDNGITPDWAKASEGLRNSGLYKDSPVIAIEHVPDPFYYAQRTPPKNGPYADAVVPGGGQRRGENDSSEHIRTKMKHAMDIPIPQGEVLTREMAEAKQFIMAMFEDKLQQALQREKSQQLLQDAAVEDSLSTTE